jgi:membrane-associated phospholipid phosphatase
MAISSSFAKIRHRYILLKRFALLFSIVFHPVMLPTLFFSFAMWQCPEILSPFTDLSLQWRFITLIFITTMAIPLAMLSIHFLLNKQNLNLKLLYLQNRKDRIYPFFHTAIFYCGITYLFHYNLHLNVFICSFMGMVSVALILVSFVSLLYKISAHVMALTAVIGYLFLLQILLPDVDLIYSICTLILIAGITASARLFLQAHTPLQLLLGLIAGMLATSSCLIWLYY